MKQQKSSREETKMSLSNIKNFILEDEENMTDLDIDFSDLLSEINGDGLNDNIGIENNIDDALTS